MALLQITLIYFKTFLRFQLFIIAKKTATWQTVVLLHICIRLNRAWQR